MAESSTVLAVKTSKVPAREILGHALGGVGQNTIYALWSSWITAFYTDVFGLNPLFMGGLFLFARIWDGFNDPMMGIIADRSKSRFGRYRCWLLRMPLFVAVFLILNFSVPNLSGTAKLVYAAITYIGMGMAFTSVDIPYWSLPAAMTSSPQERTKIFTTATLGTNFATVTAGMLIPFMLKSMGNTSSTYFIIAVVIAIIGCGLYLACFGLVREHVAVPKQAFSFKLALKNLYTNKPLLCVMICNLVVNLAFIMKMTLNYYYTTYALGDVGIMSIMSMVTLPSILLGTIAAPFIAKVFGKKKTLLGLMILNFAVSAIFFFAGYSSVPLVIVFNAIQILCVGASFVMISSMTADAIEYGEWKTGQRNDGIITSTRTLSTKIASALVGMAVAVVLTATGYVPNQAQSPETLNAFHFVVSFLPGIVMMIGAIPMFFNTLTEERHAEIVAEINARRAANEKDDTQN